MAKLEKEKKELRADLDKLKRQVASPAAAAGTAGTAGGEAMDVDGGQRGQSAEAKAIAARVDLARRVLRSLKEMDEDVRVVHYAGDTRGGYDAHVVRAVFMAS